MGEILRLKLKFEVKGREYEGPLLDLTLDLSTCFEQEGVECLLLNPITPDPLTDPLK